MCSLHILVSGTSRKHHRSVSYEIPCQGAGLRLICTGLLAFSQPCANLTLPVPIPCFRKVAERVLSYLDCMRPDEGITAHCIMYHNKILTFVKALLGTFGRKTKTSRQRRVIRSNVCATPVWWNRTKGFPRFPQMKGEQNWSEACSHPAAREKTRTILPSSFLLWRLRHTLTPASFAPHPLTPGHICPGKSCNPTWHLWYFPGLLIVKE